jgi:long-subunit acyl-CoA synthetase (AMP-forming)
LREATPRLGDRLSSIGELRVLSPGGLRAPDARVKAGEVVRSLTRAGFRRGDRLAVMLPNGPDFVATFLACLEMEVTFVPLNPSALPEEIPRRCMTAGVTGLRSVGDGLVRVRPTRSSTESVQAPAAIFFTSGSGGDAQAVALSEAALMHVADTHHRALGYARGDTILGFLPWSHAFGFTLELLMALLYEGVLRSVPSVAFPEAIQASPADYLFAVPRMIERLADASLKRLQGGIIGGAPVRGRVRRRLEATRLRVGYGQTECAPGVSLGEAGEWSCDDFLGRPIGCEVDVRTGLEDVGELVLRGPNLADGYVRGEQIVPVTAGDGWRETGDLVARTGDGLVFQGRKDELFKLDNGRMVNPVPLEIPYEGQILLIGAGRSAVQPLARGEAPSAFMLPIPHLQPKLMPEAFWEACTTLTGKVSRGRAQALFYQA